MSDLAAKHKAWLVVDAIQQLGASRIDVSKLGVDVIACGGHKWLNAPFGCARYTANVGGTRVSVHFFNNRDDIGRLLETLDAYQS